MGIGEQFEFEKTGQILQGKGRVDPLVMLKNCLFCGKFVAKDRWTIKNAPRNPMPVCPECQCNSDPGDSSNW